MRPVQQLRTPGVFAFLMLLAAAAGCGDDSTDAEGVESEPDGGGEQPGGGGRGGATAGSAAAGRSGAAGRAAGGSGGRSAEAGASAAGSGGAVAAGSGASGSAAAGSNAAGSGGAGSGAAGSSGEGGSEAEAGSGGSSGGAAGSSGEGGSEAEAGSGGSSGEGEDDAGVPPEAGSGGAGGAGGASGSSGEGGSGGSGQEPLRCGTRGGVMCEEGDFCNFEPDPLCGATDAGGVCEERPEACTEEFEPVCGCDDRTYSNACDAHRQGVSVKRQGLCSRLECTQAGGRTELSDGASTPECNDGEASWLIESGGDESALCCLDEEVAGEACGGASGATCGNDEFCNSDPAAGGSGCEDMAEGNSGVCDERPAVCTREFNPVCGCDRKSYGNACTAEAMGVSILHEGTCTVTDCEFVDGRVVFGIGPAPMCDPGEEEWSYVVPDDGSQPIEGAICCVDAQP